MGFGMVVGFLFWVVVMSVVFMPVLTPPLAGAIIFVSTLMIVGIIRRGLNSGNVI